MRFHINENQFEGEVIFKKECFFKQGISFFRDQFKCSKKDYVKIMGSEKENIEILPYFSNLECAVEDFIEKYNMNMK